MGRIFVELGVVSRFAGVFRARRRIGLEKARLEGWEWGVFGSYVTHFRWIRCDGRGKRNGLDGRRALSAEHRDGREKLCPGPALRCEVTMVGRDCATRLTGETARASSVYVMSRPAAVLDPATNKAISGPFPLQERAGVWRGRGVVPQNLPRGNHPSDGGRFPLRW
jgi:hypothetical protein